MFLLIIVINLNFALLSNSSNIKTLNNTFDNRILQTSGLMSLWSHDSSGDEIYDIAISDDGTYIAYANNDSIGLYTKSTANPKTSEWEKDLGDYVYQVDISGDGEYIAAVSEENKVFLYYKNGTKKWEYNTGITSVNQVGITNTGSVGLSSDGGYLAVYVNNFTRGHAYFFEKSSSTPLWYYKNPNGDRFDELEISSNGVNVVMSDEFHIYLLNNTGTPSKTPIWEFQIQKGERVQVDISADGNEIIGGCSDYPFDTAYVYFLNDSFSGSKKAVWRHNENTYDVSISADGTKLISACQNDLRLFYNTANTTVKTFSKIIRKAKISQNGNYFIARDGSYNIYYVSTSDFNTLWTYKLNTEPVFDISSDGSYVVLGDEDSVVYLFGMPENGGGGDGDDDDSEVSSFNIVELLVSPIGLTIIGGIVGAVITIFVVRKVLEKRAEERDDDEFEKILKRYSED